jgi:HSP20 family protein|tara:strand:+ start:9589 stop:10029 length:441 start_codon:yes stop_codon:yes gene_type:complete
MNTALTHINASRVPGLLGRTVFDDVFDSLFTDVPSYIKQSTLGYPVADIYSDDDGNTVMEFALAGFSRSDLTLSVKPEERSLTVSATSENEGPNERRIARRSFNKTYVNYNDDLDLGRISATFENGLLSVVVPRRPESEPITIDIM